MIEGSRLSPRLAKDGKLDVVHGPLQHNDIIGKLVSAPFYLKGGKGRLIKIEQPSLDQYVALTERLVTPVYASYANTIVSLLDIHPPQLHSGSGSSDDTPVQPQVEILEAGTGHGSLTLHLAQAIAATNPPSPSLQIPHSIKPPRQYSSDSSSRTGTDNSAAAEAFDQAIQEKHRLTLEWNAWKATRRAVIHTVENVQANRHHAEKIVREFRRGLYWPHVDWYHDDVTSWISAALESRNNQPFLSYVCLDMPSAHEKLKDIGPAMKEGAKVVVFVPSITQIGDCVRLIKDEKLPFSMERALELGEGISNGRRWDVRTVKPRKPQETVSPSVTPSEADVELEAEDFEGGSPGTDEQVLEPVDQAGASDAGVLVETPDSSSPPLEPSRTPISTSTSSSSSPESVMICRPQIGERTIGGGFIAIFRKTSPESVALEWQWKKAQTGKKRKFYR